MENIPFSAHFQEHYWSSAGGAAEKTHVFLHGNNLPQRFAASQTFTIAELGFGTGLTFLLTAHLWQRTAPAKAHLTYIAYEKFPPPNLLAIHATFPLHLQPFSTHVLAGWPPRPGWNTLALGPITLHLFAGEAEEGISTHPSPANAWFLDGFSPARNPEMWSLPLLFAVAKNTAPQGTFATYTVARAVRQTLTSAGFKVEKKAGLPPKRHMLTGTLC
jgi:tRNA U34 5-methylaminomethyl-2-thiouridine-forming methyltransferase MnmC